MQLGLLLTRFSVLRSRSWRKPIRPVQRKKLKRSETPRGRIQVMNCPQLAARNNVEQVA